MAEAEGEIVFEHPRVGRHHAKRWLSFRLLLIIGEAGHNIRVFLVHLQTSLQEFWQPFVIRIQKRNQGVAGQVDAFVARPADTTVGLSH
jgi:hypothetical protein